MLPRFTNQEDEERYRGGGDLQTGLSLVVSLDSHGFASREVARCAPDTRTSLNSEGARICWRTTRTPLPEMRGRVFSPPSFSLPSGLFHPAYILDFLLSGPSGVDDVLAL